MGKKPSMYLIIAASIVFVVYTLLTIVIPFPKGASSWFEFVFTIVAMILSSVILIRSLITQKDIKSKIYRLPIGNVALVYLFVQIAISIIVFIVGSFVDIPIWIPILISVVALAVASIPVIAGEAAVEAIEAQEKEDIRRTSTAKRFQVSINDLVSIERDETLKKQLSKLAEKFRYSDPVSCEETEAVENEINEGLSVLRTVLKENNKEAANEIIQSLTAKLDNRNNLCKAYKK